MTHKGTVAGMPQGRLHTQAQATSPQVLGPWELVLQLRAAGSPPALGLVLGRGLLTEAVRPHPGGLLCAVARGPCCLRKEGDGPMCRHNDLQVVAQ